jgi:hypothetical protein
MVLPHFASPQPMSRWFCLKGIFFYQLSELIYNTPSYFRHPNTEMRRGLFFVGTGFTPRKTIRHYLQ